MVRTPRVAPAKHWCFTSYKTQEELTQAITRSDEYEYIVFQTEVCPETERVHQQGFIMMKKPVRFNNIKKVLGDNAAHCEKRKGTVKQAIEYCKKDDSRQAGPFEYGVCPETTQGTRNDMEQVQAAIEAGATYDELLQLHFGTAIRYQRQLQNVINARAKKLAATAPIELQLREWQQKALDIIAEEPERRKVNWFVDKDGNAGKSLFAEYLADQRNAFVFTSGFAQRDFAHTFKTQLENRNYQAPTVVVFDIPRHYEHLDAIYAAIEVVKNGRMTSTKYEGGIIRFDPPHVLVFANVEPNYSALSNDRWNIVFLKKNY